MTDRVLDEVEIDAEWSRFLSVATAWHPMVGTPHDFARAIEQAVLAQCVRLNGIYGIMPPDGKVTERLARVRERAAFTSGAYRRASSDWAAINRELDRAYPLPTKRVPREVKLSDGRVYIGNGSLDSFCGPLTPDDMRLLLGLVERPYAEVPDDA